MAQRLKTAGRIIFAIPMGIFGLNHLFNGSQMAGMVPGFIPGGLFWVYFTGIALLAASIALIIGKKAQLASLLLGALLLVFILTMHLPGVLGGEGGQMAMINLMKDLAMIGGALLIAGIQGKQPETVES